MFIRSERLFLRPAWPEDWQELHGLIADEQVVRNLARAPWPYTADHARDFARAPHERMIPNFFVTLPDSQGARLIGCAGLARDGEQVELGYWIGKSHWGKGFASEAARAVLAVARALGHRRIVASHYIDNPASGRVLEKSGFRRTGRVVERFSAGRGMKGIAREYAIDFGTPNDCDGDDDGGMRSRLAA